MRTATMHNRNDMQQVHAILGKALATAFLADSWRWLTAGLMTAAMAVLPDEGVRTALTLALVFAGLDFITGILAARLTGHALQSSKMKRTVVKVFGYVVAVSVVFVSLRQVTQSLDVARIAATLLANVVMLTEAVSILENLDRMGAPLPTWVVRLLRQQLRDLNERGRTMARPVKETELDDEAPRG